MTHEFKAGDRVRLEGTVMRLHPEWIAVTMQGNSGLVGHSITMEAMAHATLIPPAQEPKAPPPLDTSKPMRLKTDHAPVRYLDTGVHGDIWCRTQEGIVCSFKPDALENIPTPKRTMTRDVVMVEGIGSLILDGAFCKDKLTARGTITLTEGDGMKEVQS